jgi:cellulose synthase/poly-beta-1,6-N-acetylglucosamine synthase-like glycosyltransferase
LYIFGSFNRFKPGEPGTSKLPPLSVIICANNEADNLSTFLPSVLEQDYPEFQVVVVNDCSTDDTELVLAGLKEKYNNLYYTSIPIDKKFFHGKKLALTIGIKAAKYEHLVMTDADCKPSSGKWLRLMAGKFSEKKKIVLGYGRYEKTGGLLNKLIRYETFWNAVQYFGFALSVRPFMAVGRNLAYTKQLFENSSQFSNNLMIASGDDDLFIVETADKNNTALCFAPDSHTVSVPLNSFREWFSQKSRHLTSSVRYPFAIRSLIFFEFLTRQILWLFTFCSIFFSIFAIIITALFSLLLLIKIVVLRKAGKKLLEKQLFWALLLFDWLLPVIMAILWINNLLRPGRIKWK